MRATAHRLLPTLVLALWLAPSAGALGLALHLALDDHGDHHTVRAGDIAELLRTAEHGHHHDEAATADHEHDARPGGTAAVPRPSSSPATPPAPPEVAPGLLADVTRLERPPRHGPGSPLFTIHCCLLL